MAVGYVHFRATNSELSPHPPCPVSGILIVRRPCVFFLPGNQIFAFIWIVFVEIEPSPGTE
jgi:hypothetical protein